MNFGPSEYTAYGGLRIKREIKVKKESIVDTKLEPITSEIGMDGAYELNMCIKIEPEMVSLGLVSCRVQHYDIL